jgi:hypothetical protein
MNRNNNKKKNRKNSLTNYFDHTCCIAQGTFHCAIAPLEIAALALPGFDVLFIILAFLLLGHQRSPLNPLHCTELHFKVTVNMVSVLYIGFNKIVTLL